jgi:hypothetical protein
LNARCSIRTLTVWKSGRQAAFRHKTQSAELLRQTWLEGRSWQ